jgi:hypothetical protein
MTWHTTEQEVAMLKEILVLAAGLALSAPVLADRDHRHRGDHWKRHHYYHPRPVVIMPPPRVYYTPPPTVYYAPPPAPVYYAPAPVYRAPMPHNGVSIRFHFPL